MIQKGRSIAHGLVLALIVWLVSGTELSGQSEGVLFSPSPGWVKPVEWNATDQRVPNEKSEGTRYLLYENQEHPQQQEAFSRVILLMENEAGVQDSGNLSLSFDPSYQELILHRVQIHRAGTILERLDKSKIKIIQPEPGLDGYLFTGRKTAVLFVEDLRVGDALEYAFTRRGANPILGGHFSTRFTVQSSVPVDRQRIRVVWASDRPLHTRNHLTVARPVITPSNGGAEHLWDFTNLTAIVYEDFLPDGFESYPYVELSDFDSWAQVVNWALPLYAGESTNLPPELQKLTEDWRKEAASDEERARLALQFVQDDLRYTGLELGPDSYRPAPAAETFQKRFGDCKGKALLLCTILRAMKLEAWPALVNSFARESLVQRLPSPFAFDHVIVKLNLPDGAVWVDPTRSHQGGGLRHRFLPRLSKALVVQPGISALEEVPAAVDASSRQHVTSTFRLSDYDSPVSFSVVTTYRGFGADNIREQVARTDLQDLAKEYLNFYARFYPGVQSPLPLEVSDDRTGNVLVVTEHYQIKDLWELDASSNRWAAAFFAESLQNILTDPNTRLRTKPLRIDFPVRREQEIVVHLPDPDWRIPDKQLELQHAAFAFRYRRALAGAVLRFHYELETLAPEVPVDQVAGYLKQLEAMENLLGDTLYRPNHRAGSFAGGINWLMVVLALFGMVATLIGCLWYWRTTRAPAGLPPPLPEEVHLAGLSGWLILVGLGLCISPFVRGAGLVQGWEGFFSLQSWQAVALPQSDQYHPLYAPLLIFELLGLVFLLGLNVLAAVMFFARRRGFPRAYIALLVLNALFLLIDELVGARIPLIAEAPDSTSARELLRAVIAALIWSSYMLRSKRVKATFRE